MLQVVDWPNVWGSCSRLPYQNLKNICDRIGLLILFNPMYVEGFYELDLQDRSHAIVTRVLVDLSVKEPGENWIGETFNGRPFELPATWVQKLPDQGILTLQYEPSPQHIICFLVQFKRRQKVHGRVMGDQTQGTSILDEVLSSCRVRG
jgi:hypothetical protein